jgi:hypothetical protein
MQCNNNNKEEGEKFFLVLYSDTCILRLYILYISNQTMVVNPAKLQMTILIN